MGPIENNGKLGNTDGSPFTEKQTIINKAYDKCVWFPVEIGVRAMRIVATTSNYLENIFLAPVAFGSSLISGEGFTKKLAEYQGKIQPVTNNLMYYVAFPGLIAFTGTAALFTYPLLAGYYGAARALSCIETYCNSSTEYGTSLLKFLISDRLSINSNDKDLLEILKT